MSHSWFETANQIEKSLKGLKSADSAFEDALPKLQQLQQLFENGLKKDTEFAIENEVEQNLWKSVYYRMIDHRRSSIKKLDAELESLSSKIAARNRSKNSEYRHMNETMRLARKQFDAELNEMSSFYDSLFTDLLVTAYISRQGSTLIDMIDETNVSVINREVLKTAYSALQTCYRCLIYLGDLERYHQLNNLDESSRKWDKTLLYYKLALQLFPNHGNPHNQIAVVATYTKNEVNAIYQYLRATCLEIPFQTSLNNLKLLFETNKKVLQMQKPTSELNLPEIKSKLASLTDLRVVYQWMVRIFGMSFEIFHNNKSSKGILKSIEFESELFSVLANCVISKLDELMFSPMCANAKQIGGAVANNPNFERFSTWITEIIVTVLCILDFCKFRDTKSSDNAYILLRSFLFEFVNLCLKSFSQLNHTLLSSIAVFTIWLSRQEISELSIWTNIDSTKKTCFEVFLETGKIDDVKFGSYGVFWDSLLKTINQMRGTDTSTVPKGLVYSPEEIELSGLSFLPNLYSIISGNVLCDSFDIRRSGNGAISAPKIVNCSYDQLQKRRLATIRASIFEMMNTHSCIVYDSQEKLFGFSNDTKISTITPDQFFESNSGPFDQSSLGFSDLSKLSSSPLDDLLASFSAKKDAELKDDIIDSIDAARRQALEDDEDDVVEFQPRVSPLKPEILKTDSKQENTAFDNGVQINQLPGYLAQNQLMNIPVSNGLPPPGMQNFVPNLSPPTNYNSLSLLPQSNFIYPLNPFMQSFGQTQPMNTILPHNNLYSAMNTNSVMNAGTGINIGGIPSFNAMPSYQLGLSNIGASIDSNQFMIQQLSQKLREQELLVNNQLQNLLQSGYPNSGPHAVTNHSSPFEASYVPGSHSVQLSSNMPSR